MTANVWFFRLNGQLMFHLDRPSRADPKAEPFVYEGPATKRHIAEYPNQHLKFLAEEAKPKFVSAKILSVKNAETIESIKAEMVEASNPILES